MGLPVWYLAAGCLYSQCGTWPPAHPRMRCKWFCSRGLFTGSGVVEAGRKAVVGQRLKLSGMRRAVPGAEAIIALRGREASSHREERSGSGPATRQPPADAALTGHATPSAASYPSVTYKIDAHPAAFPPRPESRGLHAAFLMTQAGFSLFPGNIVRPPRAWLERTANVVRVTEPARGGHFAPFEEPELYAEEQVIWSSVTRSVPGGCRGLVRRRGGVPILRSR